MNDTIKAILRILTEGKPELRIAAAQVLGELRPREVAVTNAVAAALEAADGFVGRHLLQTLAHIGTPAAIRALVDRLDDSTHADLVAHMLREVGPDAAKSLKDGFEEAPQEHRARALAIVGSIPCKDSMWIAEHAIYDAELAEPAGAILAAEPMLDALPARDRKALKDRLVKALGKRDDLEPRSIGTILQVVAASDAKAARPLLIKYCEADQPTLVRHAALLALRGVPLTPTQATNLLDNLDDADRLHIVDPTIELLVRVEKWTDAGAQRLRKLLSSNHLHLRLFACQALAHAPAEAVVRPLVALLEGPVAELREAAVGALAANRHAFAPLLRTFSNEKAAPRARLFAGPLRRMAAMFGPEQLRALIDKGVRRLLAREPVGEIQLEVAVAVDPETAESTLVDRAQRARKAKKLEDALTLLLFLAHVDLLGTEARYQLALTRLLLESSGVRVEHAAAGDATMGYFAALVRDGFDVLGRLKRESMVSPEALLRVGAHFAEAVGPERRFGAETLHWVAEKHSRARAGEEARIALRAEGL